MLVVLSGILMHRTIRNPCRRRRRRDLLHKWLLIGRRWGERKKLGHALKVPAATAASGLKTVVDSSESSFAAKWHHRLVYLTRTVMESRCKFQPAIVLNAEFIAFPLGFYFTRVIKLEVSLCYIYIYITFFSKLTNARRAVFSADLT